MDSVNNTSKPSSKDNDQSSRHKRKLKFSLSFVVIFAIIIGSIIAIFVVLKHETESEAHALYDNPEKAIRAACSLTRSPILCTSVLQDQQARNPSKTINPSKIFTMSLHAAFNELVKLISITQEISEAKDPKTLIAAKNCESLVNDSLRLLNKSKALMGFDPDQKTFKEEKKMTYLKELMFNATANINKCKNAMNRRNSTAGKSYDMMTKMRIDRSSGYVENSFLILMKMDLIHDMFEPPIRSVLTNPMLNTNQYVLSMILFCSNYVFLIILLFLVLRLWYINI